jgi:hypothetical protein
LSFFGRSPTSAEARSGHGRSLVLEKHGSQLAWQLAVRDAFLMTSDAPRFEPWYGAVSRNALQ